MFIKFTSPPVFNSNSISRPLFRLFLVFLKQALHCLQQINVKIAILGFKPSTFRLQVSSHNHWASHASFITIYNLLNFSTNRSRHSQRDPAGVGLQQLHLFVPVQHQRVEISAEFLHGSGSTPVRATAG